VGTPDGINGRALTQDLNGVWEGYYAAAGLPTDIRIHHGGNHITAELLHDDLTPTGHPFFRGDFGPKMYLAKIELSSYGLLSAVTGSQGGTWTPDTLDVLDPDHFQIGNRPAFQRITMPLRNDIPCSSKNDAGIEAPWAGMRGRQAHDAKDFKTASCWFYVAAVQGDAKAQWFLAYYLHEGLGVTKDTAQAFQWARKSAENGNDYGAFTVSVFYERGDGTAPDPLKAKYWHARGKELQLQKQKGAAADKAHEQQQRAEMLQLTALTVFFGFLLEEEFRTSPDCDLDKTRNTPEEIADKMQRVKDSGRHCEYGELVPN
jgi:hypothetical protein